MSPPADHHMPSHLLIVTAPSGAGKSTIVRYLMEALPDRFAFSVSATSRPRRDYEEHGVHYYFYSLQEIQQMIDEGAFVEWEEVYPGKIYGTLKSEMKRITALGKVPIFDVEVIGASDLKAFYPQAFAMYIRPPSLDVLRDRLLKRGTETPETLRARLARAESEMQRAADFDYILVNDLLEVACAEAELIVSQYLSIDREEE